MPKRVIPAHRTASITSRNSPHPVRLQPQPVLTQLNTLNLRTQSPALDLLESVTTDDGDDGDTIPIPVPVPRRQTQATSSVSSPVPTFPPRSPLIEVRSPHSYGYSHVSPRSPPMPAWTPSMVRPAPPFTQVVSRSAPTRFPPSTTIMPTTSSQSSNRRFAAPLPFTRIEKESVALPIVDLGTAGRSGGLLNRMGGDAERREKGEGRRGDERELPLFALHWNQRLPPGVGLPSPTEVLHVRSSDLLAEEAESGTVVHAAVLPPPHERRRGTRRVEGDVEATPLIGIAFDTGTFLVYSLKTHRVVRRVEVVDRGSRIKGFEANERFIVVGTINPPSLYILSSNSLDTIHVIGQDISKSNNDLAVECAVIDAINWVKARMESMSVAFGGDASMDNDSNEQRIELTKVLPYFSPPTLALSTSGSAGGLTTSTAVSMLSSAFAGALSGLTSSSGPTALSHRPAYGEHSAYDDDTSYDDSTTTTTNHPHTHTQSTLSPTVSSHTPPPHAPPPAHPPYPRACIPDRNAAVGLGMGSGVAGLPSTQAELGTAALRVGGSVLSGMRTLGGLAVSAARSRVGGAGGGEEGSASRGGGSGSGAGRFLSRSAPEGVVAGAGWGRGREAEDRERERDRERRYSNTS
ncbi:hypothetical protein Hypma_009839 [Hypsizygus marmoreus]|uniref:Uncharacterized protein n=1 Tax=Hypsizygus marmoreus TaxID=39966 RepID=A0A369JUM4_HYPMA|nr:hypothetical protein Hypma_009839 [Hypsizygus marmoreus]